MLSPWSRVAVAAAGAACVAILALKVLLAWRINVNWDEFYFLNHVHALKRGELDLLFQTAYTHAFQWLTVLGTEMDQVVTARLVMLALLGLTGFLAFRLAIRWVAPHLAVFAPLAYLASSPVLMHGGSFRYDSLLAPLTLAVLLFQTSSSRRVPSALMAGACFGLMLVISLKAVLLLPVVVLIALASQRHPARPARQALFETARFVVVFGLVSAVLAGSLLLAHSAALAPRAEDAGAVASSIVRKSLIDVPFAPRLRYFLETWQSDKAGWLLVIGGILAAIARRKPHVLALALSLLPILFYRNAFPYYYVVMLAPACILAAFAVDSLAALPKDVLGDRKVAILQSMIAVVLILQASVHLFHLRTDEQTRQRAVIAGVHTIFPRPVPYIDHSGMIATFPKTNFFMSSWGLENYRARGEGFVREALRQRPPLLLVNLPLLDPLVNSAALLPEDRKLLRESYVPYWGPVWVAGTQLRVEPGTSAVAKVPFPGPYRLVSPGPLLVNGAARNNGDTILITEESNELHVQAEAPAAQPALVQFVWAAAGPPPPAGAPAGSLYKPLGKERVAN